MDEDSDTSLGTSAVELHTTPIAASLSSNGADHLSVQSNNLSVQRQALTLVLLYLLQQPALCWLWVITGPVASVFPL